MFVKINRFAADPNRKDQRVIRFPKLLDVYSMCDASLQKRIATGRNLHLAEIQKHANSIAAMKGTLPSKK